MNKTNFKLFTMFLAGIAFSAMTVLAATISISTNFEDGVTQYLKKLVILKNDNNTWITLDWDTLTWKNIYGDNINWNTITGSSIYGEEGMFEKYCNYGWTGCVSYEELTQWWWTSLWSTWTFERIYYNSWNVGIGTNTPAYKFTVNWTGYFENWLYVNWVIWPEDNWDDLKFLADWYLFKNWWGDDKLVINSQGYVGIGTNDPDQKLVVNVWKNKEVKIWYDYDEGAPIISSYEKLIIDAQALSLNWSSFYKGIMWAWTPVSVWINWSPSDPAPWQTLAVNGNFFVWKPDTSQLTIDNSSSSSNLKSTERLELHTNGSRRVTINKSGYVGIWTASPSSKLEVVWNTKISGDLNIKNNSLYVGGTNGYVGIGTWEPTAKLHIAKTWADWYLFKATDIGSKDRFWIHDWWDAYVDGWLWIGINPLKAQGNTQKHALLVNWTSYLSGNVGIGKNPSYKLDVAGTGYFEKWLIVDGTVQIGTNLRLSTLSNGWAIYSNNKIYLNVNWSQQAVIIDTWKNMTVVGDVTATAFYYDSDERLKTDISTIVSPLQKILSLSGYNFTWIKDWRQDIWIIAQEVEKIFPEIVQTNPEWYKSVEYGNLVAPLIEAIKELNAKIDRQAQEIAILKANIQ